MQRQHLKDNLTKLQLNMQRWLQSANLAVLLIFSKYEEVEEQAWNKWMYLNISKQSDHIQAISDLIFRRQTDFAYLCKIRPWRSLEGLQQVGPTACFDPSWSSWFDPLKRPCSRLMLTDAHWCSGPSISLSDQPLDPHCFLNWWPKKKPSERHRKTEPKWAKDCFVRANTC